MAKGASSGISFDEYMRKKKEEEETKKEEPKKSTSSTDKKLSEPTNKSGKTFGESVYENYTSKNVNADSLKKWFTEAESTIKSTQDYVSKNQFDKYNTDYGSEYSSKVGELLDSYDAVSAFVKYNKDGFEDYDSISNALDQYTKYLREFNSRSSSLRDYYSKFDGEGDYLGYIMTNTGDMLDVDSVKRRQDAYAYAKDRIAKSNNKEEREQLQAYVSQYERGNKSKDEAFAKYASRSDYEKVASNRDFGNSTMEDYRVFDTKAYGGEIVNHDTGERTYVEPMFDYSVSPKDAAQYIGMDLSINDPLGFYFSTIGDYAKEGESVYHYPKEDIAGREYSSVLSQGDKQHWSNLKEDEIEMYYFLLNEQGKDVAVSFLNGLESELGYRETVEYAEYLKDASALDVVFANALSIPATLVGGTVALVDDAFGALKGEDPNFYDSAHGLKNFADTTRGVTAQTLNDFTNNASFLGMTTGDVYQSLMSGADSLAGGSIFGNAYLGLMSTGAMSSGVKDLYENGASTSQILTGSLINGAAEYIGEKIAFDHFFKMKGNTNSIGKLIASTLMQGGYEMGGEMVTELTNIVGEAINLRSQSEWAKLLKENDGAFWETVKDLATEKVWKAGAGGFISGMLMGGGQTTADYLSNRPAVKAEGQYIMDQGGVEDLKALALDLAGQQKGISNFATKVSLKSKAGNVSNTMKSNGRNAVRVGQLSNSVDLVRDTANVEDIASSLIKAGVSKGKANEIAEHIYYKTDYDSLSKSTKKAMESDAVRKIVEAENTSVSKRNRQYAYARAGLKETDDGEVALSDHNQQKLDEFEKKILKADYAEKADAVKAKVSENGTAKVIKTDTEVTLKGIDHIETVEKDGKEVDVAYLKVADADGNESVVEWGDVEFSSRNEAVLYETFVGMDIDPVHFDAFVKNFNEADFDGSIGEAAVQYAIGFRNAYRYGWANMETELGGDVFASKLTESVRNTAYTLGKETVTKQTEAKQKSLDTAVAERKASGKGKAKTNGKLHMEGVKTTKRTAMQNAGVGLAKRLTDLGIDVYVYESRKVNGQWVDENGNVAPNGYYRAKDGSIHIDLNAGEYGQGIMVYTLAHELTHFMRDKSPKQFKAFADLLVKWYGEKGETLNGLITKTMNDENLSWDDAYEEVIARSCESFLTDSNIADRILELQNTDKGLWETIRDKVLEFLKWMKSLFANVNPESYEGDLLHQYKSEIDHLYDAFYNTLADAVETNQWAGSIAEAKTNAETLSTAGITVDADTGSAVMNSVRYAPKTQAEIDKVAKALSESMGVSIEKAKAWVKSETSLASVLLDPSNAMFLDYEADDRYEAIKKNAEYPQGTVDFSNLCKKRREFTALLDKLQKEHPNRIITAEEMEKIRQILIEENVEVACGLCYVEERRQLLGEIAQGFIDGYKNGTLKENIAKELDGKDTYVPTIYDLITYDGYRALATEHPSIAEAFKKFNNARGMQAGRLIEGIAEYKRDILNWSQKKVDFVNSVGGLRVFSFSDFEATHLIDLVQVVQDCAAKGVMIQAYTKVPAFANAVKDTNMKVNRSLIAKGTGIKYENGRMVLDLDPVEGIDINDKDFFDSTNSENVGNVLVGMSNEQIRLAMKTPFVDYIIPFHTSLKGEILGAKKIDHWDNYKNFQTDKEFHPEKVTYKKDGSIKSDGWVVAENQINVYVDVIQAAEAEGKPIKNKVDFVNKFLAVAKEKGLKPRFWQFLDVDANGEYTYTEGYHKFLVDFKLFDQQGNILPQKPVVPEFDDALNARILSEYVEGKKTPAPRDAVYDRLENEDVIPYFSTEEIEEMCFDYDGDFSAEKFKTELKEYEEDGTISEFDYEDAVERAEEMEKQLNAGGTRWAHYKLDGGTNYREIVFTMPNSSYSNQMMRVHWGEDAEGVLVHARIQDFDVDGQMMLFVEEIQSDWHNEGHKTGYAEKHKHEVRHEQFNGIEIVRLYVDGQPTEYFMKEHLPYELTDAQRMEQLVERLEMREAMRGESKAPDAPFRDTYHEYVLKRLIRMAAEEGYDSIGWTPAQIQSERWSDEFAEGYRIEYDQDIPKFLRKYGKKWGAEVGRSFLPEADGEVWTMPITDSMKDSVLYEGQVMYQRRGTGMSNRSILANALDSATQHESEARRLAEYKEKIDLINAEEQKLYETRERIKELSFASGPKDTVAIKNLQDAATRIANRINTYDKQLLNLEATAPLKALLAREKEMVRKREKAKANEELAKYREKSAETLREVMTRNSESRKRNVESRKRTVVRNKIKRVVTDLNGMLNRGTKERNVKTDMQETVGSALKLANVLFNDEITNEDIVLMGSTMATEEEQKLLDQYVDLIKKRDSAPVGEAMKYINKMSDLNRKLADLFKRERARLNQAKVSEAVDELAKAYANLKVSDKDYVNAYYSEEAHKRLLNLSESLGGTVMKDMSLDQLEEVYDAYKMIRHIVRESNSLFRMGKTQDLAKTVTSVQGQILSLYKEREKDPRAFAKKMGDLLKDFAWNEMKPLTAFETLGADAYTELFWDAIKAEGEWAKWMEEANAFLDEQRSKFNYKSWDMDTAHEFTLPDGKVFRLTLQEMLSIYAYSKREQAQEHMTIGGFQFDKHNVYKDNDKKKRVRLGDLYVTDWSTIGNIIGSLTDEQKHYADAVQKYLTDMGQRGNEVSEILYGIGIFNETAYFPLMSAKDYRSSVEEALNNTQTQVSLKNTGMTKQTVPHASNPIILQRFDDVAIGHIDKMAKYCTQVLAIENLRRVFDSVSADDNGGYASTKAVIEKVFGESAKKYFDQYITDLNGGTFTDGAENPWMTMFSKFKGTAVGASLSVVVQQPMAVVRAMDVINAKHFIGGVSKAETDKLYDEIKRYAPVAILKEMGGFDVGSSRTARDYLGVRTDKGFNRAVDEVNDIAMWGAGKADKLGWGIIWKAVKREVASNNEFKPGTAEFLEACGERFTEVIVRTQVYDSVNSRSGYMRSKRDSVKYAMSFMGEPTTVINEAYLSMLKLSRANGKQAKKQAMGKLGRTMGVLVTSTLLTTLAKSLVYAMRDKEDDEALLERWAKQVGDNLGLFGDLNPMTMLPWAKDIVSIFEGFGVDRPDMTLIGNVIKSARKLWDRDDEKQFTNIDEVIAFIGDTANMFGLPVKNVIRDAKGIVNAFGDIFDDVKPTDMGGAFISGLTGEEKAKADSLYDAIVSGDTGKVDAIKKGYKDDKAVESAIRKALRENDPRIKEAAKARYEGDVAEYMRIVREIKAEGHFSQDTIVSAINTEISKLKPKESKPSSPAFVTSTDYYNAIVSGQSSTAESIKNDLIAEKVADGDTQDDAEDSVVSGLVSQVSNAYKDGELSRSSAESILSKHCDKDDDEIYWTLDKWDYAKQNGSTDGYSKYGEFHTAVETGKNLKATIKRYTDHGVEAKTLASQITSYFKPLYKEMSNAERANIKGYLLNAYTLLGYNRFDKSKDIDAWLKD